jgi:hypothetical protein
MREKLNDNPVAQAAVIGVLLLGAVFFLMGGMGGGSGEAPPAESSTAPTAPTGETTTVTGSTATPPVDPATGAPAVDPATGAPLAAAPVSASGIPEVVDPQPLPAPVVSAYKGGRIVVLLVVRQGGIEDRMVSRSVASLEADGAVEAFVVPVNEISRYTALTQGVGVNRAPAMVVVNPKATSGGTAQASVSYGFQSPQTVVQAVRDAAYQGPEATTYSPD